MTGEYMHLYKHAAFCLYHSIMSGKGHDVYTLWTKDWVLCGVFNNFMSCSLKKKKFMSCVFFNDNLFIKISF